MVSLFSVLSYFLGEICQKGKKKKKGFYHKKKNIIIYIFSEFRYSLYLTPASLQSSFMPIRWPGTVLSKFTNDLSATYPDVYLQ